MLIGYYTNAQIPNCFETQIKLSISQCHAVPVSVGSSQIHNLFYLRYIIMVQILIKIPLMEKKTLYLHKGWYWAQWLLRRKGADAWASKAPPPHTCMGRTCNLHAERQPGWLRNQTHDLHAVLITTSLWHPCIWLQLIKIKQWPIMASLSLHCFHTYCILFPLCAFFQMLSSDPLCSQMIIYSHTYNAAFVQIDLFLPEDKYIDREDKPSRQSWV